MLCNNGLKIIGDLVPDKPTVLAISGVMVSPCIYDQIEVTEEFQLGAVDYFYSTGPWDATSVAGKILTVIEDLNLGPTVLVGYSAGGVIAMAAACQCPEKIAGLMLSNTGPCTTGLGDPGFHKKILEKWEDKDFINNFLDCRFSRPIPPLLKVRLLDYIAGMDKFAAYGLSSSLREIDLRSDLRRVTCPIVIAHGVTDKYRTAEHAKMIRDAAPQTEFFPIQGGHTVMVDNKEEWQKCFLYLLSKVSGKYKI